MTPTDAYQMLQLAQWFQWFLSSQVPLWAYSVQMEFTEAAEMFVYDFEAVRTLEDGCQDRNKEYEFEVWRRSWRSCRSWGTLMLMRSQGPSVDFKVLVPPSFVVPKTFQNANFLWCCKILILQRLSALENDEGVRNFTIENRFSWKKLVLRERSRLFSPEMAASF